MKGSSERWPKRWLNDDHFLSFSVLTDTSPQRESSKTTSLLVRNHSFFMAAAAFSSVAACSAASAFATSSFQSLAHFMSTTPNPQERWGTHKKRWPFQPCPFADVIGLVRRSYTFARFVLDDLPDPGSFAGLGNQCVYLFCGRAAWMQCWCEHDHETDEHAKENTRRRHEFWSTVGEHIVYGIWKAFNVNDMSDMCANMESSLQSRVEHFGCLIIYWKGWGHEPAPDLCVRYVTFFAHVFVSKDLGTCRFEEIRHDFCSHCEFHPTLGHCRAMLREGKHRKHT